MTRRNTNGSHRCEQCAAAGKDWNCNSSTSLSAHIRRDHGGEPLPCPQCAQTFNDRTLLGRHVNNVHAPREDVYWCPVCQKDLGKRSDNAKRHCRTGRPCGNGGAPFKANGKDAEVVFRFVEEGVSLVEALDRAKVAASPNAGAVEEEPMAQQKPAVKVEVEEDEEEQLLLEWYYTEGLQRQEEQEWNAMLLVREQERQQQQQFRTWNQGYAPAAVLQQLEQEQQQGGMDLDDLVFGLVEPINEHEYAHVAAPARGLMTNNAIDPRMTGRYQCALPVEMEMLVNRGPVVGVEGLMNYDPNEFLNEWML